MGGGDSSEGRQDEAGYVGVFDEEDDGAASARQRDEVDAARDRSPSAVANQEEPRLRTPDSGIGGEGMAARVLFDLWPPVGGFVHYWKWQRLFLRLLFFPTNKYK